MGSSTSNLENQITYYYLFHKKLERFFLAGYNPFYDQKKGELKVEKFYIINKNLLHMWKNYCNYGLFKSNLDEIHLNNGDIEKYKDDVIKITKTLIKTLGIQDIPFNYYNDLTVECKWYSRNILQFEHFDNIVDEKTYEYFETNIQNKFLSDIQGIITNDRFIIFYERYCQMKFLYRGECIESKDALIQLTADFTQIVNTFFINIFLTKRACSAILGSPNSERSFLMSKTTTQPLFSIRFILLAVLAVLAMLLPAKPNDVRLTVQTPVTTETTAVTFTVENRTRRTISYPEESFAFEKQTDAGWEALEVLPHAVIEPMYEQMTGLTVTQTVHLELLFGGTLDAGTYRLTFFYTIGANRCSAETVFTVTAA